MCHLDSKFSFSMKIKCILETLVYIFLDVALKEFPHDSVKMKLQFLKSHLYCKNQFCLNFKATRTKEMKCLKN